MSKAEEVIRNFEEYPLYYSHEVVPLLRQQEAVIKQMLESLLECRVHEGMFDFGPAYGIAKERRKDAIAAAKEVLK